VQVGDRESDIFDLMCQRTGLAGGLLVRSQHNRVSPHGQRLWDEVQACDVLGEIEFAMSGRTGRKPRVGNEGAHAVEMTCLVASEVGAPAGEKPVCCRLPTNCDTTTLEQARELIGWYRRASTRSCATWQCSAGMELNPLVERARDGKKGRAISALRREHGFVGSEGTERFRSNVGLTELMLYCAFQFSESAGSKSRRPSSSARQFPASLVMRSPATL